MPDANSDAVQIGEWLVQPAIDTLSRGGETHKIEPRMMRLLVCLASSAGAVVSVDQLLGEVWSGVVVGSASVYQAVSQLRKLLGDTDENAAYIATVPRKGYRLIATVRRVEAVENSTPAAAPLTALAVASALSPATEQGEPAIATRTSLVKAAVYGGAIAALVILAALMFWGKLRPSAMPDTAENSIAVLPFVDLSPEKSEQSFCDGLTEELSNWLSQIPTLRVVARTSAFAFRGHDEDVRKIGKALDSSHILEGSMRRVGDHVRITVQLIDTRNGYHLWSSNFDRKTNDTIGVQEDISRSVAETLKLRLTAESDRQFAARRTTDTDAYQQYLLARYYDQQLTPEATDRSIELYGTILSSDPSFAVAYVNLARARLNQGYFHDLPIRDVAAQMEPLIASALRIDDRLGSAYAVRGSLRAAQLRPKEALEDLALAIALNPSDMSAFAEIGRIRLMDGQPREALKSYDSAAALDPLNSTLQLQRCVALGDMARNEEAAGACERARNLQPGGAAPLDGLAWLAESRGRLDEALQWNLRSLEAEPREDFDLYWTRATFFLSLSRTAPARTAVERGRVAVKEEDGANAALVRVAFCEGGAEALRSYVGAVRLDDSVHAVGLFEAAYAHLVLGEAAKAKELIARALNAPDLAPGFADSPWYARGARIMGTSYRIDLAVAELDLGERAAAEQELNTVLAMLDRMIAAGVERSGTYELRAKVYALKGEGDNAMRDLSKAAKLGWRREWWASHEPYFVQLRSRPDFQSLMAEVGRSNEKLIGTLKAEPSA